MKAYFYDWTRLPDSAARFENYVAVELKTILELWTDAGIDSFELYFIRDRDGKETDFLVIREGKPWLMLEAKNSKGSIIYYLFFASCKKVAENIITDIFTKYR